MGHIRSSLVHSDTQKTIKLRKEILEELKTSDNREFKLAMNPIEEVWLISEV